MRVTDARCDCADACRWRAERDRAVAVAVALAVPGTAAVASAKCVRRRRAATVAMGRHGWDSLLRALARWFLILADSIKRCVRVSEGSIRRTAAGTPLSAP